MRIKKDEGKKHEKAGFNSKLFNRLESVNMIRKLSPIKRKNMQVVDDGNEKCEDTNSDNEDFFESSLFWKHQKNMSKGSLDFEKAKKEKAKK